MKPGRHIPVNPQDPSTFGLWHGSAMVNPFDPPRQMPAHAASVISLALSCQRRRNEPQRIAEVGVWQGVLSRWLLVCLPFATVHLIDPWKQAPDGSKWRELGDHFSKAPQEQHDAHHALAHRLREQFSPRAVIHRDYSLSVVKAFDDEYFDLVFVDGAHDYQSVKDDLLAWYPKVRIGGYLAFHDYRPDGIYFGLVEAVHEAVRTLGRSQESIHVLDGKVGALRRI